MNILGIDYGRVYLGLAISQEGICSPLKVVKSKSDNHKLDEIIKLVKGKNISKIVFGFAQGKLENHIRGFIKKLKEKTKIETILVDETLTSNEALKKMIEEGVPQKKRREMEHAYAACLILNMYLEENG